MLITPLVLAMMGAVFSSMRWPEMHNGGYLAQEMECPSVGDHVILNTSIGVSQLKITISCLMDQEGGGGGTKLNSQYYYQKKNNQEKFKLGTFMNIFQNYA